MLALRVYAPDAVLSVVMTTLTGQPGVDHVVEVGRAARGDRVLVTADVDAAVIDDLLPRLTAAGVPGDEIEVHHLTSTRPLGTSRVGDLPAWSGGGLALTELTITSRQYARAVPQYLVFMACAGVIAVYGVLTSNPILIVGAMAISPDLLPMCATCVGIVNRHLRLAARAVLALLIGLGVAGIFAMLTTWLLRAIDYPPATDPLGDGGLGVLPSVNASTVGVAFVAGIAGMLSFETRSSSAVGVAISITTIPAAAYAGAAVASGLPNGAADALAVLGINIVMLVLGGTLTLVSQRALRRRYRT